MELSVQEYQYLVSEIARETGAKRDGSGKNLIVPHCPYCGKSGGKFGIYIGKETAHRQPFNILLAFITPAKFSATKISGARQESPNAKTIRIKKVI